MNIQQLNKAFDHRIRLGIMSALAVNEELNFNTLKEVLQLTDGNLASHLKTLEDCGYLRVRKAFIGRKTNTTYAATAEGLAAFKAHLQVLEDMIKQVQ
jgi:Predicted transcriptional regulator